MTTTNDLLSPERIRKIQERQVVGSEGGTPVVWLTEYERDALLHAAALQAQLDAAVKMNRELKIIVDIGTDDDPGTALSKLHKIQHQAVEQFRRRAVEAMRARCPFDSEADVGDVVEEVIELIQQLPATAAITATNKD